MSKTVQKGTLLYEGKGKKVYRVQGHSDQVILFFKNDLTAAQGRKKGTFKDKGQVCKSISSLVFRYLNKQKISNHWKSDLNAREMLCLKTQIFPLEVVLRNRLAGSTAQRLGLKEGSLVRRPPLLEFYYKKDELDDPFISERQILQLNLIQNPAFLPKIKEQAILINKKLKPFFLKAGLELVDFKLEFGLYKKKLFLADDISPDSCRIWDCKTNFRLDKDRFRRGWGQVDKSYKTIEAKLYKTWEQKL